MRVPVPDGSVIDLTLQLERDATVETINDAVRKAAEGPMRGIVSYNTDPIVSSDIIGDPHSSIFDAPLTQVIGDRLAKVISWYDNKWGYSSRVEELIVRLAKMDGMNVDHDT
jgi:glyceraldehyde 3-phosphate dehydrogenase